MTLLLLALACAPKPAPASPATAPPAGEREALEELADDLATHPDGRESAGPAIGAALAEALAERPADPLVRARALELLSWLRQADLAAESAPVPVDTGAPLDTADPDPDGLQRDARATTDAADTLIEMARGHLRRGAYRRALDALRPLRDSPSWEAAQPFWEEAVDGYVAAERERLGAVYLDARDLPHEQKIAAFEEVRAGLEALLEDYPDSAYAEPLQDNLERVERALESAHRD